MVFLVFLVIAILGLMYATNAFAEGYYGNRTASATSYSESTVNIYTDDGYSGDIRDMDSNLSRGIAISAAVANLPAISHDGASHKHTAFSVAVGGYNSENALAIGLSHMQDELSVKSSIGFSGDEAMYGVGAGWSF